MVSESASHNTCMPCKTGSQVLLSYLVTSYFRFQGLGPGFICLSIYIVVSSGLD